MPLDPRIPLGVESPKFNSPFEILGQMQQLKAQQQVLQSNQALEERRRQEIAEAQRKQAEDTQWKDALRRTAGMPVDQVRAAILQAAPDKVADFDKAHDEHTRSADLAKQAKAAYAKAMQDYTGVAIDQLVQAGGAPVPSNLIFNAAVENFPELTPHVDKLREIGIVQGREAMLEAAQAFIPAEVRSKRQEMAQSAAKAAAELPGQVADSAIKVAQAANLTPEGLTPQQAAANEPASLREWEAYKQYGGTLGYNDYMTMDANRKRPVSITNAATDDRMLNDAARHILANPRDLTSIKTITSLRGDQRLQLFNKLKALDPNFNVGNIDRQIKFLDSYEDPKGRAASNRGSMNNILQHASDLSAVNEQYRRTNVRFVNTPLAQIQRQSGTEWQSFATPLAVLKDEIALYFAGGYAPSGDQAKTWERIVNDQATPAQVEQFAKDLVHVGLRRADTHNEQFKTVMGYDDPNLITPQAVEAATKLGMGAEVAKYGSGGRLGTAPSATMKLKNQRTGEVRSGPRGPVPPGFEEVR